MNVTSVKRIHQSDWQKVGIPFYRARDIVAISKGQKISEPIYISENKYKEFSEISGKVKINDLLVTGVGTIGVPLLVQKTPLYFKDGNIIWFQNNNQFNGIFLYNAFLTRSIQNFIKTTTGVGTVPTYTIITGKETPISFPKPKEQDRVATLLKTAENLITLQQRKLEQLKQLKKAMLQYLLTTAKKSDPLIRNKNYNNKWDTTTFSKLLNYERPENYIVTNTNYRKNGIPVLTANKSFILGYTNEPNVYNKGEAIIFDDFTLENKFVNFPFMIKSSAIKILTSKVNYSLYFIFQLLQHTKFIKEGHARHYISVVQKQIVKIPPSYEEQESISDTFSRIQSLIKLQQNKIDQYTTLKKYLLQKMFI